MKREFITRGIRIRESEDGTPSRTIEGYAVVFDDPSANFYEDDKRVIREKIAAEAITKELLDNCDIIATMFHNDEKILGRSDNGTGTLAYEVDDRGVKFSLEAPSTSTGDEALDLVRRGDIKGCSFAFTCDYDNPDVVSHEIEFEDGKSIETFVVRHIDAIYDFTLTLRPAYPTTECSLRELSDKRTAPKPTAWRSQVAEIRSKITKL